MNYFRIISLLCGFHLLLFASHTAVAQFVDYIEVTAELEVNEWDYWFFEDERQLAAARREPPRSIFSKPITVRCVVGTNTWLIESETGFSRNAKITYWFTGTNLVKDTIITRQSRESASNKKPAVPGIAMVSPSIGERWTGTQESTDGNPGRTVRVGDLMQTYEKICWLAFCSGSCLQRDERKLFPPSDIWKEIGPLPFRDKTVLFDDPLKLPRSVEIFGKHDELAFQYSVRQTTNVFGCTFPLEFYLVQYRPPHHPRTNSWELLLTGKGKITSIGLGAKPEIPQNKSSLLRETK